jgi:signal transduction histidine kinase
MKYISGSIKALKKLSAQYPAVLSGYIIYGYLFVAIIRLFLKVKHGEATLSDAYDIFSALPFMWLLAVALVKVIEIRTKLHESQTEINLDKEQLRLKEMQLNTMKEVVKGLQHHVNNPLAIITLYVSRLRRKVADNVEALDGIEQIGVATKKISSALAEFSAAERYEVEHVGLVVGNIAVPPKHNPSETTLH